MATKRAEKTLATRRRMVRAAYEQFCANGYAGTTIAAVAAAAGVAVPTIYYTFGTKASLLDAALGGAIIGFERWRPAPPDLDEIETILPWHPWWTDFDTAETSAAAFDVFLANGASILERVAPMVAALHGTAGDPEASEVARLAEERRVDSYREVLRRVARLDGGLGPGMSVAKATDITTVLFSAELYQALRVGRGWSARRCRAFLHDLLVTEVLGGR